MRRQTPTHTHTHLYTPTHTYTHTHTCSELFLNTLVLPGNSNQIWRRLMSQKRHRVAISLNHSLIHWRTHTHTDSPIHSFCRSVHKDEFGTQRVYKKTSPNCVLTLYLPTREITLTGNNPSVLRGIVFVDPKAIQGYRVYAQLTLTFR